MPVAEFEFGFEPRYDLAVFAQLVFGDELCKICGRLACLGLNTVEVCLK